MRRRSERAFSLDLRPAYPTIVIDPPWPEHGGTPKASWGGGKRGADAHYPTVPVKQMPDLIMGSGVWKPEADAHLYLWVTKRFLPDGLWLMQQLGFVYKTQLTWVKSDNRIGLGQYFRGRSEPLLFGVRGRGYAVRTAARNLDDLIVAPRTVHSRKPPESYLKIEARSRGPYLEMFARGRFSRPGWTVWGNQAL